MLRIIVNDYVYFFFDIITLYQALIQKDWYLPRFCYHVKLLISGNCRMCVVEVKNALKPVIACASLIFKNMEVILNSILVFKARESVLQFILNNHPLDCPICDQGGECDLQDQYIVMGSNESRYYELNKKFVKDKNISFVLKLSLNKCINCSRCTRFSHIVNGDYSFSLLGRGENIFISNYIYTKNFNFEISGNVMDLCPVGAITSKSISYEFRNWELNEICFVDYFDPFHPSIRIDYKGLKVVRVLPLMDDYLNEEWISDRLRLNVKSFYSNRNLYNYYNDVNLCVKFSWKKIFYNVKNYFISNLEFFSKKKLFYKNSVKLCKSNTDVYCFLYLKLLFKKFFFFENEGMNIVRNNFRNQGFLKEVDKDLAESDTFIFYNLNIRNQYPILNFKIREKSVLDFCKVILFGFMLNINYYVEQCVSNYYITYLKTLNLKKVLLFVSRNNELFDYNYYVIFKNVNLKIKELSFCNNLSLLFFEFGKKTKNFVSKVINNYCVGFLFNDFLICNNNKRERVSLFFSSVYETNKVLKSDFVFPLKQVFEKSSIFINIFGLINDFSYSSYKYFFKELKNDWFIFKSFFNVCGVKLKFKISNFKNYIISFKWKFSKYFLKIFFYYYISFSFFLFNLEFNYDYTPVFLNDNLSKKNKVVLFLQKIDSSINKLINFVFNNKIFWLF